jgi:uncharacterized protein YjbI with pentapeptide repeats
VSKQASETTPPFERPTTDHPDAWRKYWQVHNQPWRTEPEIDKQRQEELAACRTIVPNIEKGIYPFNKANLELTRADIEWLLATHEDKQGPVEWNDESQRKRKGLDLRGADLHQRNLSGLPLASMIGGLNRDEWVNATPKQRELAAVRLDDADLRGVHLEGAILRKSSLELTNLRAVHLEKATLFMARLNGAYLIGAHLEGASLSGTHLEGATLTNAHLEGANLQGAFFNNMTSLENATLGDEKSGFVSVADVRWGDVNLSVIDWSQINKLGDERRAQQLTNSNGKMKDTATRRNEYQTALRANRQLAVVLQNQGLNEEAARFAYRAQRNQRSLLQQQVLYGIEQISKLRFLTFIPKHIQLEGIKLFLLSISILFLAGLLYDLLVLIAHVPNILFEPSTGKLSQSYIYHDLAENIAIFCLFAFCYLLIYSVFFRLLIIFLISILISLSPLYILFIITVLVIDNAVFIVPFLASIVIIGFIAVIISSYQICFLLLRIMTEHTKKINKFIYEEEPQPENDLIKLFLPVNKLKLYIQYLDKIRLFFQHAYSKTYPFILVQVSYGRYLFSLFLDTIAGYGYKPVRSLIAYLLIIVVFASLYYALGHGDPHPLSYWGALVYSVTSFHGRGFFPGPGVDNLDDPLIRWAAFEAIIGLIIEISFIATFTKRFLGN